MGTVAHYLPEWALYVQAIGTPVATAAVVGYFAWWQARIAREKLKLDIYDKRFKVFEAFRELTLTTTHETKSRIHGNLEKILSTLPQSYFLFDNDTHNYLLNLVQRVQKIQDQCEKNARQKPDGAFAVEYTSEMRKIFPDLYKELLKHFEKYLRLSDLRSEQSVTITKSKDGFRISVSNPFKTK